MPPALAVGLSAVTAGYRGLLEVRERLYGWGVLKSRRLPCPVISIGNLTLGGTGKTPAVELAVLTLRGAGVLPGVVSRGYGRHSAGVQVVADRRGLRADPQWAGDEPFLLARRLPGVPVVVGENRYEAGRRCLESFGVQALVLDDAFQHRTLEKDLEVVLVAGQSPWGNGHLFPRGPLREPLSSLARSHLVVVTNGTGDGVALVGETLRRHNPLAPIVAAEYQPVECWQVRDPNPCAPDALRGRRLLAFAGIARPEGFRQTVERLGVCLTGLVTFPDHHWYSAEDLTAVIRKAEGTGAEGLVTTEKDYVRLSALALRSLPIWILSVRLAITEGHAQWREAFDRVLPR
ncbi:MAG: tetraacyldisaccharide 4'-kinase [Candidatus Rokubacteria bacterium]|nr:tetraacyldisaccharide 4'-kinase [Candidatus Rokubacteria bacterium]